MKFHFNTQTTTPTDATILTNCTPFVSVLNNFTTSITQAIDPPTGLKSRILTVCDNVRDYQLVDVGVKLEDVDNDSEWLLMPKDDLIAEREAKLAAVKEKARSTLEGKL